MLTEKYSQFNVIQNGILGAFFGRIRYVVANPVD